jgi:hypothetical protein
MGYENKNEIETSVNESKIEGRNAVLEAFRSGKTIDKLYVLDGCQDGPVKTITREARKGDTIINYVTKDRLDQISETGKHQGVIGVCAAYNYAEVEDILRKAEENTNVDYQFHYSYLIKVMKQYIREYNGQMAYFDGQSTFDLLDGTLFINLDISQLEERFARPLAQQILLSWIWEKYVKKNSEDKKKARKKRVIVDEAWMMLPYPEAVDFLNTMARRARKRNVSLAVVSQKFQDFYEVKEAQAVLTSSDTKLFLAQDKAEIAYLREVFKLSKGEADFLSTCGRGQG